MGIHISFGEAPKAPPVIDPSANPEKFLEVRDKLCNKRKALEWNLANRPEAKEVYESELAFHKEAMKTFGITEVDYIAFLEKSKSELH